MKKTLLQLALILASYGCFSANAFAQYLFISDNKGRPVLEYNTINLKGSPYLHPEWTKGSIVLNDGKIYQNIDLMYDQVADMLLFKDKDGSVKELMEPMKEFQISFTEAGKVIDKKFRKGFSGESVSPDAFLEVLSDGEKSLLKKTSKKIFDLKGYNSATINREVQASETYYVATGNKLVKVKKTKSSLLAAMPEKAANLELYIKSNSLNLRNDSDMVKLVAYYNSL